MNENEPKWTWDKFVVQRPTEPSPPDCPKVDDIEALVSYLHAATVEVHIFPEVLSVIVVVTGCELSDDDRYLGQHCDYSVQVVTHSEFRHIQREAAGKFLALDEIPNRFVPTLVANGILTYDDLSIVDPEWLSAQEGITESMAEAIIDAAERHSEVLRGRDD